MAIKDGNYYEIGKEIFYMKDSPKGDLSKKSLLKFINVVEEFKTEHKLRVVYHPEFKYYLVAMLGVTWKKFKWTEEMNDLSERFDQYLLDNKIIFE
jgi:hypothetical protein